MLGDESPVVGQYIITVLNTEKQRYFIAMPKLVKFGVDNLMEVNL